MFYLHLTGEGQICWRSHCKLEMDPALGSANKCESLVHWRGPRSPVTKDPLSPTWAKDLKSPQCIEKLLSWGALGKVHLSMGEFKYLCCRDIQVLCCSRGKCHILGPAGILRSDCQERVLDFVQERIQEWASVKGKQVSLERYTFHLQKADISKWEPAGAWML